MLRCFTQNNKKYKISNSLILLTSLWLLFLSQPNSLYSKENNYKNIKIDKKFKSYFAENMLLMEMEGAKVIRDKDGKTIIISVASTVIKDEAAKEQLRAEKICKIKAIAGVVAEKKGIQVFRKEVLNERTIIKKENEKDSGESLSELIQVTQTKIEGISRDMPVVGTWRSKDGKIFFLAIGTMLDKNGDTIEEN